MRLDHLLSKETCFFVPQFCYLWCLFSYFVFLGGSSQRTRRWKFVFVCGVGCTVWFRINIFVGFVSWAFLAHLFFLFMCVGGLGCVVCELYSEREHQNFLFLNEKSCFFVL